MTTAQRTDPDRKRLADRALNELERCSRSHHSRDELAHALRTAIEQDDRELMERRMQRTREIQTGSVELPPDGKWLDRLWEDVMTDDDQPLAVLGQGDKRTEHIEPLTTAKQVVVLSAVAVACAGWLVYWLVTGGVE